jgi:DNA-directed RNA polymerase specialized sigma24 family protein
MLALLNRLRDHLSAREPSRASARTSQCMAVLTPSAAVALHQQAIEQDAIAWAYRQLAQSSAEEPEQLEPVDALLEQLAPQQLVIVDAWFRRELTCEEIAAAQGISGEEARARVHQILRTLRDAE